MSKPEWVVRKCTIYRVMRRTDPCQRPTGVYSKRFAKQLAKNGNDLIRKLAASDKQMIHIKS